MSQILNPEDVTRFDKKDTGSTLEIEERTPRKKAILVVLTLILFFSGYTIAPDPMSEGRYEISFDIENQTFTIEVYLDPDLDSRQDYRELTVNGGIITYFELYPMDVGSIISFSYYSSDTITINTGVKFTAIISNSDLKYTFIGNQVDEKQVDYQFKILSDTNIALGLLFAIAFLWLTELIPLAATSLIIPVVLSILKIQSATQALSYFSEPIIFLFLAGFLMAEAMQRTKLDKFISYRLFYMIPPNGKVLLFSMMTLTAVFSMFMSNTAAVAILIPLTLQLLKGVDVGDASYRKTVVLSIAYAATIGGIGSQIGTPPNIIAVELLKDYNPAYDISFLEWFYFGLPVVAIMLPIVFLYLNIRFKPQVSSEQLKIAQIQTKITIEEELQLTKEQFVVMIIFVLTFSLWLTSQFHEISTGIVALLAAVLLYFVGQLEESDLNKINWNALITFGGGLSLGGLIIQTGLAEYIGSKALFLTGFPTIIVLLAIGVVGLILTAFASNTASAIIMIPIVMPLGSVLGISPITLAVTVAIVASIDFAIVIGTPPTMMAYSTGLFRVEEIFRIGIILDIIGLILVTIISYFLFGIFALAIIG